MPAAHTHHSLDASIRDLGPWFHNLHLPDGTQTAPDSPLGDFPAALWNAIAPHIPSKLTGWRALDIGCNAGFFSFELARRGANVLALDIDDRYLAQARWACSIMGLEERIRFRQMGVYDLPTLQEDGEAADGFDLVWFTGVFYHLRYPLLGLDLAASLARRMLVFQSLQSPGRETLEAPADLPLNQRDLMMQPGWPRMSFIERRLAGDPTNWWAPNYACTLAMLRSAGMRIIATVPPETCICEPAADRGPAGEAEATANAARFACRAGGGGG